MNGSTSFLRLPIDDLDDVFKSVGSRWEHLRGQKILLTGGTGFIGKWLLGTFLYANRKLRLGAQIRVLSRSPSSFLNEYVELQDATEIEWLAGDVRDLETNSASDCEYAIHGATDVTSTSAPGEIFATCDCGTRRVLEAMTRGKHGRQRVLLLSSGAIYGRIPPDIVAIREDWFGAPDPLVASSAYGEGKRVSELHCAMATATHPNLEISIARCFAFVGPHLPLDKHFAIGNFIKAAISREDIHIRGDGTPLRSYLYAADLAHWLWVMLFEAPKNRAYNVGGSQGLSILELANRVNEVLAGTGEVQVSQTPLKDVVPSSYVPSIDRIATELGLQPKVNLEDAILRTARWVGFSSMGLYESLKH
jgi:nucleoside-diphosphate-sugar epimerase